jgi:hypothetical protein
MKTKHKLIVLILLFAIIGMGGCGEEEVQSNEDLPEWLLVKINEIEFLHSKDISIVKVKIFQGEWNKQIVYHIWDNLSSCVFCEVYYGNGEKITWNDTNNKDDFDDKSKDWKLIYEYGDAIEPTDNDDCASCEGKEILKVLTDEPAYIKKRCFEHLGRIDTFYFELVTHYEELRSPDIFPCNIIPEEYRKDGLPVKISGNITNCMVLGGCSEPNIKLETINVFELKSIIAGTPEYGEEEQNSTEIPFTEYSLTGTNSQWVNFESNKVVVINNQSEMDNYITNTDGNYPEIDFSKSTLLLVKGVTTSGISTLSEKLLKSGNKYTLEITIVLNDAAVVQEWHIALVSEKLNANVELNVIT